MAEKFSEIMMDFANAQEAAAVNLKRQILELSFLDQLIDLVSLLIWESNSSSSILFRQFV